MAHSSLLITAWTLHPVSPASSTEPVTRGPAQIFVDKLEEDGNLEVGAEIKEQLNVLPEDPLSGTQWVLGVMGAWKACPGAGRQLRHNR